MQLFAAVVKSELVTNLEERFPALSRQDVIVSVDELLAGIHQALLHGNRVEIRGFGVFHLTYRKARLARNPKSGEKVQVRGKYIPHFRVGKDLREAVEQKKNRL